MLAEKILIADANVAAAGALQRYLHSLAYELVFIGSTAEQLAALCREHRFRVVFLDFESLANWPEACAWLDAQAGQRLTVVMHWNWNPAVEECMKKYRADYLVRKTYEYDLVGKVLLFAPP